MVHAYLLFHSERILWIDSHPLHVVGEDGYRFIVMYFTLPARNSKSSRYLS